MRVDIKNMSDGNRRIPRVILTVNVAHKDEGHTVDYNLDPAGHSECHGEAFLQAACCAIRAYAETNNVDPREAANRALATWLVGR